MKFAMFVAVLAGICLVQSREFDSQKAIENQLDTFDLNDGNLKEVIAELEQDKKAKPLFIF
jgi:hypothetical protein